MTNFTTWLAEITGQTEDQIISMLKNPLAMHFLVAWSLFESKCIKANANEKTIQVFATQAAISLQSKHPTLEIIGDHFYIRYQNKKNAKQSSLRERRRQIKRNIN